jgi:SAM-dependent methyltransferase
MQSWEAIYKTEGIVFKDIHPAFTTLTPFFKKNDVSRILDLGSGSGRHVLWLVKNGFEVYGLDISPTGVDITKRLLQERNLIADVRIGDIYKKLPYSDRFFDVIISIQTLHHNTLTNINLLVAEMERVLVSNGYIFITVPAKMNQAKHFKRLEKDTYVPIDGMERGLPHHYFNEDELRNTFFNFRFQQFYIDEVDHYAVLGVKTAKNDCTR